VAEGLAHLQTAVRDLLAHPEAVMTSVLAARKCAGRVRRLYQTALARLFGEELSTSVLKRRELLRRLDIIGLRLAECADALSDAMQKRSH
jgi:hypothetical protein